MGKGVRLDDKQVMALLVRLGQESIQEYFSQITEQMRQDVTLQIEDLRARVTRAEMVAEALLAAQPEAKPVVVIENATRLDGS